METAPDHAAESVAQGCDYTVDGHHVWGYERHGIWPWQTHVECWLCERLNDGQADA